MGTTRRDSNYNCRQIEVELVLPGSVGISSWWLLAFAARISHKLTLGKTEATCDIWLRLLLSTCITDIQVYDPKDLERSVRELNLDVDDDGDDGLAVTALATSPAGDELALGLRNGSVNLYTTPSLDFKSILTRFTAPVLGLDYGMDGTVM